MRLASAGAKKRSSDALGQRRQPGGDNPHERVANLGDEMRQLALPEHFAQTAGDSVRIAVFRGQREVPPISTPK
jgi:hypothetical protein